MPTVFGFRAMNIGLPFAILLAAPFAVLAQVNTGVVVIERADSWKFDASVSDMQRLVGNVRLKLDESLMFCDSARVFEAGKRFEAFGHVTITRGDSLTLRGDRLTYSSEDRFARIRKNVVFNNKEMILATPMLDYNLETEIGWFTGGGTITSTSGDVLTANEGVYYVGSDVFHFRDDVVLTSSDYTVTSDTLHYNERTSVSGFFGPTVIRSGESVICCERGFFDSSTDVSRFWRNASIESEKFKMWGDSIAYFGQSSVGMAFGNVTAVDSGSTWKVTGQQGYYDRNREFMRMTGRALMIRPFAIDTLFLAADTLVNLTDSLGFGHLLAFPHVRIHKPDLQGRADSVKYSESDSLMVLLGDPVLWNEATQIWGDTINVRTSGSEISSLNVMGNGKVMGMADDSVHFNQIAGRTIIGAFGDSELRRIKVFGNARSLYFPSETKKGFSQTIGLNSVVCSEITIDLLDGQLQTIRFDVSPSGTLSPLSKSSESDRLLEGFHWRADERPESGSLLRETEPSAED